MKSQFQDSPTPAALVDINRLEANIERMASKAKDFGVMLRPHIKTHKCIEIGEMQKRAGSEGITVSTLGEAYAFAHAGFNDITYAVPIAPNKMKVALTLGKIIDLKLLIDHQSIVNKLEYHAEEQGTNANAFLKVDCGYHRCGVDPESQASIDLAKRIDDSDFLRFEGILTHAGHSYNAFTSEEIRRIGQHEQQVMVDFAEKLKEAGIEVPIVSIGSTPTISLTEEIIDGITEIRPGNYVFYDWTQVVLGSCKVNDCAFTVLSSVIGAYDDHIVLDAGATALSKDAGAAHLTGGNGFGRVYEDYTRGIFVKDAEITSLSQEHGKMTGRDLSPGTLVRILPNHSCLTANLYDTYLIVRDDEVVEEWKVLNEKTIADLSRSTVDS